MAKNKIDKFKAVSKVINEYDLNQMQYDALWDLLDDNPLLSSSASPALNKALKTSKQNIIGAINELLSLLETTKTDVTNFDTLVKQTIGEISGRDAAQWEALLEIDKNVVCAILKIWQELGGASEVDITELGANVKEALFGLNERLNEHEVRIKALERLLALSDGEQEVRETPTFDLHAPNILKLSKKPNDRTVLLTVNGVEYDEGDEFVVDRESKIIRWVNDVFNLDFIDDEFDVQYYVNI